MIGNDNETDRHGNLVPYSTFIGDCFVDSYNANDSEILDDLGVAYTEYGQEVDSTLSLPVKALMIWNSMDRDKMMRTSSDHFMEQADEVMLQWNDDSVRSNPERIKELYEKLMFLIQDYIISPC